MSMKDQLLEHYNQVLVSLCQVPDKNGKISLAWPGEEGIAHTEPTVVKINTNGEVTSKALVMPTDAVMADGDAGSVFFHPLSENIIRGESEVLKVMRNMVRFRINATALSLMEIITELATGEDHKSMTSQQQVVLKAFANATKKARNEIKTVLDKNFDKITSVFLKRKHTLDGDTYRRVATITFPLRNMIKDGSKMVGDYEMSSLKNTNVLAELIDYVFPTNSDPLLWSAGSNSDAAPYYESLLLAYAHVAERLNKLIKVFKKHIPNADALTIPTDFKHGLQNIDDWKLVMRPLEGNIGAVLKGEKEIPPAAPQAAQTPKVDMSRHLTSGATTTIHAPAAQTQQQPQVAATPPPSLTGAAPQQAKSTGGGKDWRDIKASTGVPQVQNQYNPNTMMMPPQMQMQGMMPQMGLPMGMGMGMQMPGMMPQQMGNQMGGYGMQMPGMMPQQMNGGFGMPQMGMGMPQMGMPQMGNQMGSSLMSSNTPTLGGGFNTFNNNSL